MIKNLKEKFSFKAFLYLIPLSFSTCIVGNVLVGFLPGAATNEVSNEIYEMLNEGKLTQALIIVGVFAPIIEELFFRLFLYYLIKRFFGHKVAIIFTAIAFAIAHFNLEQGIYAFFAGLVLGYVRYRYDSVFCTIFMHLLMNVIVVLYANSMSKGVGLRESLYLLFIALVIFILSLYRIKVIFKERRNQK